MKRIMIILKTFAICLLAMILITMQDSVIVSATEGETELTENAADTSQNDGESSEEDNETPPSDSAVAVVEIQGYSIESGSIDAGKNAEILLDLRNVSNSARATGVMLTITSNSGMIYPAYGTDNQIYVGTISAGGTTSVTVPVTVNRNFTGDYADFTCRFDYESDGRAMSNSASLVLPSSSGEDLYVNSVGLSSRAIVNANSLLSVSYTNRSVNNIDDAALIISGNVSDDSKEIKLGTVYADKSYMKDYHITFTETGEQEITISLSYTNSSGEAVTRDLGNYKLEVSEETIAEQNSQSTSRVIVWIGRVIAALALAVAAVAVFLYIKQRLL